MGTFICHPERDGPYPVILFFMDAPGIREELRPRRTGDRSPGWKVPVKWVSCLRWPAARPPLQGARQERRFCDEPRLVRDRPLSAGLSRWGGGPRIRTIQPGQSKDPIKKGKRWDHLAAIPVLLFSTTALAAAPVAVPPATAAAIAYMRMSTEELWVAGPRPLAPFWPTVLLFTHWLGARPARALKACSRLKTKVRDTIAMRQPHLRRAVRLGGAPRISSPSALFRALLVRLFGAINIASERAFGRPGDPPLAWLVGEVVPLVVKTIAFPGGENCSCGFRLSPP